MCRCRKTKYILLNGVNTKLQLSLTCYNIRTVCYLHDHLINLVTALKDAMTIWVDLETPYYSRANYTTMSRSAALTQITYQLQHWPVYAWLGVYNLVQAGHLEAICIPSLAFIQEVPKGQNHLQNLSQTFTPHHLTGRAHNSWGESRRGEKWRHLTLYMQLIDCGRIIIQTIMNN